jgi:lysophospholipase L1-like esterase
MLARMQGRIGCTGIAIVVFCALTLVAPVSAHASDAVSAECAAAKEAVAAAKKAVQRARAKLRRAREEGDKKDVERARRKLRGKQAKLEAAKADEREACAVSPAPYVALGDSIAAYAGQLFPHYQATLGATQFLNRSRGGESSGSIRTSGQLAAALTDINSASDTRVVTINIGGVDALYGSCTSWSEPSCPFRANFDATLDDLVAALAGDPGDEPLVTMAYHNPNSGRGDSQEAQSDARLLGSDGVRSCSGTGAQLGLNDVISQEAAAHGALLADAYTAIKQGGQAYMADAVHPNATGYAAIAEAFKAAAAPCG